MNKKCLDYPFQIKQLDENGVFSGYGTVWGDVDVYSESLAKGSIKRSLKKREPAMLWQHNITQPVGVWTDIKEDDHGLYLEGKIALDATFGRDAYALMRLGAVKGLSIGFIPVKWSQDKDTRLVTFAEVDLYEVSVVTFPALNSARIDNVKSFFNGEQMPTVRDVEAFLRDAGLSKSQAMTFISKGYQACLRDSDNKENKEQENILRNINLLLEKLKHVNGDSISD